jgi:aminoglycoside phosphotransferase (APT) family kinase protein
MSATPRHVIDSVVRSVCGHAAEQVVGLTGGGLNEAYRVELASADSVVLRVARRPVPWYVDEEHVMAQARAVGVPTPEVLGVKHLEHDDELLSFSVQRLVPGRSLEELAGELPASDVERLVMDGGELLARVHSVPPGRGIRHELEVPDEQVVAHLAHAVDGEFGRSAAAAVERGADLLRDQVITRPAPTLALAHGDWMPKHLLIDNREIVGVIDWELAGPASPAVDLGRWEVSAGGDPHHGSELLCRGYARVADPDSADAGWVPAFAIDWALEVLGWKNPADPAYRRRCVEVLTRYAGA